ncbi:MAG TPA: HD-GYP domain-containing protein [Candidatus Dormibacteraeota bacterium]|nr:HD-GYP domain-containing protein [Candidatus Dormibacteraeota bacterium]
MSSASAVHGVAAPSAPGATKVRPHSHSTSVVRSDVRDAPAGSGPHWAVMAVVAATTGAAGAVGVIYIRPPSSQWSTLLIVFALVALLEARGGVPLRVGRSTMNFSAKAYASIGAVYLLGLPAAAASSLASLIMSAVVRRAVDIKTVFNGAMSLLVYASAFWIFDALAIRPDPTIGWLLLAGAAGGLAAWVTNQALLGLVMIADQGIRNFRHGDFFSYVVDAMPYYIGYGLTGIGVVAAAFWLGPIGALLTLAAPVAIVQTATNRWMRAQQARAVEAQSGFNATLVSLSKAIDLRDSDTEGHCRRVVDYSLMMGRYLKLSDEDLLRLCHGALLHDIGKIGVPDAILHKPGPLTEDEWRVMRTHPQLGALMVADVRQLEMAREVILAHHERFDGKGYPSGLMGAEMPLAARVFTIADAFDAMISDRPYRAAMSLEDARAEVVRCSGTQFDPKAVEAFNSITDVELEAVAQKKEQPTEELLSL